MTEGAPPLPGDAGAVPPVAALPPGRELVAVKQPSVAPRYFAALGNPLRWEMVRMLADGRALCATDVAGVLKRDFDGISKHLRVLRRAGVVRSQRGQDRRMELFYIPEANRPAPGVLVWGNIRVDLESG